MKRSANGDRAHRSMRERPPDARGNQADYARGYCTIGDIMKQMAFALSTPFDSSKAGSNKS